MAGKNALRGIVAVLAALAAAGVSPATTASGQARRPETPRSVRLYVFDGGTLQSDPARYRLTKEDVGTTELSVGAYLIVHPKGILMWDTGAVPDSDWTPTGKPVPQRIVLPDSQERFVTITTPLGAQLKAAGYSPADVTHLALSHEHWDHTANANAFANATWLVRQVERDAMFVPMPVGAVRPATYASLRNSKTVIVTADEHDVFGDGTVILKAAAGHTPGHQVLYLKMAKTGAVVLFRRSVSLPSGADARPAADLRVQRSADARRTDGRRGVSQEDRRRALDSTQRGDAREAEEGARLLRVGSPGRGAVRRQGRTTCVSQRSSRFSP